MTRQQRNEKIREQFDGQNYTELAKAWGLTVRMIRYIVDEPRRQKKMKQKVK